MADVISMAGPSRPSRIEIRPLGYELEYACPPALSHKPISGATWPHQVCGPSTHSGETGGAFLRRRYLETLHLPEILMPLRNLQDDVARLDPTISASAIAPLLISLKQLEKRHRRTLRQLMTAMVTDMTSTSLPEVKRALLDEAVDLSGLENDEVGIVRFAIEMRGGSRRAVDSGSEIDLVRVMKDLERREALIQTLLLFHYIPLHIPDTNKKRKKYKSKSRDSTDMLETLPSEEPKAALNILMDRLSIWSALADMSLDPPAEGEGKGKGQGKGNGEDGWAGILKRFWTDIIVSSYLNQQPELCASFHQKIFAAPIPSSYLPPPRPPIRPSIPSRDQISRTSSLSVRSASASASRAPSETSDISHAHSHSHSHTHSHANTNTGTGGASLHRSRSISRTSTSDTLNPLGGGGQELRRSRSRSIDPVRVGVADPPKRPLIRAPSGKDLFKGREVGLMRRTASRKGHESLAAGSGKREDCQTQIQSPSLGLLGRKTSDPKRRRVSNEGLPDKSQQRQAGTLILATPAKQRYGNPFSSSARGMQHPTPIREELNSAERERERDRERAGRPGFIAETPSSRVPGTPSTSTTSRIAETPRTGRVLGYEPVMDGGRQDVYGEDEGDVDGDDFDDLMVMTDEETEDDEDTSSVAGTGTPRLGLIPETPVK